VQVLNINAFPWRGSSVFWSVFGSVILCSVVPRHLSSLVGRHFLDKQSIERGRREVFPRKRRRMDTYRCKCLLLAPICLSRLHSAFAYWWGPICGSQLTCRWITEENQLESIKLKGLGDHMLGRSNWNRWKKENSNSSRENAREMLSP